MYAFIGGALLYGLAIGGLYMVQDGLLFPRSIARHPMATLPASAERLELVAANGERLIGTFVPARRQSRGLVLGFPGNAWNADDFRRSSPTGSTTSTSRPSTIVATHPAREHPARRRCSPMRC